jgi:hypothetical protein
MEEICQLIGQQYKAMVVEQDVIGWRRSMEGMLSKNLMGLQADVRAQTGEGRNVLSWAKQLVVFAPGGHSWAVDIQEHTSS